MVAHKRECVHEVGDGREGRVCVMARKRMYSGMREVHGVEFVKVGCGYRGTQERECR